MSGDRAMTPQPPIAVGCGVGNLRLVTHHRKSQPKIPFASNPLQI